MIRGQLLLGLALACSAGLSGCGPVVIGALLASGGGGGGDDGGGPTTVNFTETEPNNVAPGNFVGSMFPGRTYVISGGHPAASGDVDFFRVDATSPVRMRITLSPNDLSDLELLVGVVVDNNGAGGDETFSVDMNSGDGFSSGSREFNNNMSMYTMRLVGESLAPPVPGLEPPAPPAVPVRDTIYVEFDRDGNVRTHLEITDYVRPQPPRRAQTPGRKRGHDSPEVPGSPASSGRGDAAREVDAILEPAPGGLVRASAAP